MGINNASDRCHMEKQNDIDHTSLLYTHKSYVIDVLL